MRIRIRGLISDSLVVIALRKNFRCYESVQTFGHIHTSWVACVFMCEQSGTIRGSSFQDFRHYSGSDGLPALANRKTLLLLERDRKSTRLNSSHMSISYA